MVLIVAGLNSDFSEQASRDILIDDSLVRIIMFIISMGFVCFITSGLVHVILLAFKED
jgi:hypothetical protein